MRPEDIDAYAAAMRAAKVRYIESETEDPTDQARVPFKLELHESAFIAPPLVEVELTEYEHQQARFTEARSEMSIMYQHTGSGFTDEDVWAFMGERPIRKPVLPDEEAHRD